MRFRSNSARAIIHYLYFAETSTGCTFLLKRASTQQNILREINSGNWTSPRLCNSKTNHKTSGFLPRKERDTLGSLCWAWRGRGCCALWACDHYRTLQLSLPGLSSGGIQMGKLGKIGRLHWPFFQQSSRIAVSTEAAEWKIFAIARFSTSQWKWCNAYKNKSTKIRRNWDDWSNCAIAVSRHPRCTCALINNSSEPIRIGYCCKINKSRTVCLCAYSYWRNWRHKMSQTTALQVGQQTIENYFTVTSWTFYGVDSLINESSCAWFTGLWSGMLMGDPGKKEWQQIRVILSWEWPTRRVNKWFRN